MSFIVCLCSITEYHSITEYNSVVVLPSVIVCRQESSLQTEEQRQLNKIFLQDFCNSDYIISPIDKHETQRSSVSTVVCSG